MKLLPESRKKTIWALVLLFVSLGGTIYVNFFMGKKSPPPPPPPAGTAVGEPSSEEGGETREPALPLTAPGQNPAASSPETAVLLPYGLKFDTSILESDKFKILKGAPRVEVTLDELGKPDPFK